MGTGTGMESARIRAALDRAQDDTRAAASPVTTPEERPRSRRLAIGDPQAPFETFLSILEHHGALGEDGRLKPEVQLVSMGDHFDWGGPEDCARATEDGERLLAWLLAHPPDQAWLVAGNHDMVRVGELARFDDESFQGARAEALRIYRDGRTDPDGEAAFLARHPDVPTAETVARDFSSFRVRQRDMVLAALRAKRMRLAHAFAKDLLLLHAGVTVDDLDALGLSAREHADAFAIAAAMDAAVERALAGWDGTPMTVDRVHVPGNARDGEGRGILYQRAGDPEREDPKLYEGPPRRRFDPRRLPRGLTQAIGHIRDRKSRSLLGRWAPPGEPADGVLRHLRTDGRDVHYAIGTPEAIGAGGDALVLYTDVGMLRTPPSSHPLLDLETRRAAVRP